MEIPLQLLASLDFREAEEVIKAPEPGAQIPVGNRTCRYEQYLAGK
jgi:hypothetical protein